MQYRTHLSTSMVISLPILASSGHLSIGNVIAIGIGCLLPDIDEPNSFIGRRTRGVSDLIHSVFGHRGMTHSLLGMIFLLIPMLFAVNMTPLPFVTGMCVVAGYFLHLLEDSFSISGIKWFLPFSKKKYQSGFYFLYYRTGSKVETAIFFVGTVILIFQIRSLCMASVELLPRINGMFDIFF